jgi:hypothetical protein
MKIRVPLKKLMNAWVFLKECSTLAYSSNSTDLKKQFSSFNHSKRGMVNTGRLLKRSCKWLNNLISKIRNRSKMFQSYNYQHIDKRLVQRVESDGCWWDEFGLGWGVRASGFLRQKNWKPERWESEFLEIYQRIDLQFGVNLKWRGGERL